MSIKSLVLCAVASATCLLASSSTTIAETITVTDIAGRSVQVEKDPERVILGEAE